MVKYIVPSTTIGPVCSAVTSGSAYRHTTPSRPTFDRSISASGEKRSPASVRLNVGQSPGATFGAGEIAAEGGVDECPHAVSVRTAIESVGSVSRIRVSGDGTRMVPTRVVRDGNLGRFRPMRRDRSRMTARIVPLRSDEAGDSRVAGTAAERLALLAELSRRMWALTRLPVPSYTRATMPVKLTTLAEQ